MRSVRICIAFGVSTFAAFCGNFAKAFPDGAPWGAADPAAEQHCGSCHFDADPVRKSPLLSIQGLPRAPEPGVSYQLKIVFDDPDVAVAGFQLLAQADEISAGKFSSPIADADANESAYQSAIRSTSPVSRGEGLSWLVGWRAPNVVSGSIIFYVAALSANDDGSPFGDTVHFRAYKLTVE